MLHLAGFGGEQLVKLRVLGEVVRKGQDDIVEEQQPVAGVGIGHIFPIMTAQYIRRWKLSHAVLQFPIETAGW